MEFCYFAETKDQWARDDPAFLVLLSFWLCGEYFTLKLYGFKYSGLCFKIIIKRNLRIKFLVIISSFLMHWIPEYINSSKRCTCRMKTRAQWIKPTNFLGGWGVGEGLLPELALVKLKGLKTTTMNWIYCWQGVGYGGRLWAVCQMFKEYMS